MSNQWTGNLEQEKMAATPDTNRYCLIWLGRPTRREQDMLAASGWELRMADPGSNVRVGMRGGDMVVCLLLDLRDCRQAPLDAMEKLLAEHTDLPSVVLVSERTDVADPAVRRVLQACDARLDDPLVPQQVGQVLAAFRQTRPSGADGIGDMIGESAAMLNVRATLHRYSQVDLPVLITGETGTGKELAARALHQLSARSQGPYVAVNCGALPPTLVQAELFGHERGAFTGANARRIGLFESANGGTIFLDEIGDLPLDVQTNLLRVLQEGTLERIGNSHSLKVDVRVLAATHVDLEQAVEQGRFREDLYYRLDVLRLNMPPLRERGDDVELLAKRILEDFRRRNQLRARCFSADARQALRAYSWPGNVRELLNRVRRAAVIAGDSLITPQDLQLDAHGGLEEGLDEARVTAERETILATLRETGFNISACARRLRVSRVTVYRLCKKHRLQLEELR